MCCEPLANLVPRERAKETGVSVCASLDPVVDWAGFAPAPEGCIGDPRRRVGTGVRCLPAEHHRSSDCKMVLLPARRRTRERPSMGLTSLVVRISNPAD